MQTPLHSKIWFLVFLLLALGVIFFEFRLHRVPQKNEGRTVSVFSLDAVVEPGPARDSIPAIDHPTFEGVVAADQYLKDDGFGLDVEVGGRHRFYPFQLLVWHEVVNDTFLGKPLLMTYSPLTNSGIVYERLVQGSQNTFGTSGKLWNNNTLLYDRKTESLWSQMLGRAVVGDLTGQTLTLYSSLTMLWQDWKRAFPNGEVLSREAGAKRDYTLDPYAAYRDSQEVRFPLTHIDSRLHAKQTILGVSWGKTWQAFLEDDARLSPTNDFVGDEPVLIVRDPFLDTMRAFDRKVGERVLTFEVDGVFLTDQETGSSWSFDGRATRGPLRGTSLTTVPLIRTYWFAWAAVHPETNVYLP